MQKKAWVWATAAEADGAEPGECWKALPVPPLLQALLPRLFTPPPPAESCQFLRCATDHSWCNRVKMIQLNLKIMSTCLLFYQVILTLLDMHAVMIGDLRGDIIYKMQIRRVQAACSRRWVVVFWVNYSVGEFGGVTLIIRERENLYLQVLKSPDPEGVGCFVWTSALYVLI